MLYVCAVRFDMMENMKTLQKFLELNKTLHYVQQSNYGKIVFFLPRREREPAQQENPRGVDENTDENRGQHRTARAAQGSDPQGLLAHPDQMPPLFFFLVSFPFAKPEPGTLVFKYALGPSSASPVSVCQTIPPNNTRLLLQSS
jgi:hypothetical protein